MNLNEVAPPTKKHERMVKHIKNNYKKDGKLTDKEKSIAYATAWKNYKEEVVDETLSFMKFRKKAAEVKKPKKAQDAGAKARRAMKRREHAKYVSGSEDNVPDDIRDHYEVSEGKKKGLWDNIHAKRKRGEKPAKPGDKDYPKTLDVDEGLKQARKNVGADKCWDGYKAKGTKKKGGKEVPNCVKEGGGYQPEIEHSKLGDAKKKADKKRESKLPPHLQGDAIGKMRKAFASEGAAWTKKSGKSASGGLNEKGRKSYERENPGSDLKAPQPEGGSRKKSFCARMGGMKKKLTSAKTANDPDSRINKALRKWKC